MIKKKVLLDKITELADELAELKKERDSNVSDMKLIFKHNPFNAFIERMFWSGQCFMYYSYNGELNHCLLPCDNCSIISEDKNSIIFKQGLRITADAYYKLNKKTGSYIDITDVYRDKKENKNPYLGYIQSGVAQKKLWEQIKEWEIIEAVNYVNRKFKELHDSFPEYNKIYTLNYQVRFKPYQMNSYILDFYLFEGDIKRLEDSIISYSTTIEGLIKDINKKELKDFLWDRCISLLMQ